MTHADELLERRAPSRWLAALLLVLGLIAALVVGTGAPANVCASEGPLQLKRGVSIHEWLNWAPLTPKGDYKWPPYRDMAEWGSADDFARIKALGLDFVRLSVDPGPLLASEGTRRDVAVGRLEEAVRAVTNSGLKVVLDLHPVGQVKAWSPEAIESGSDQAIRDRYRSAVSSVARMLERVGTDKVALELMNEPQYYPCDGSGGREWEAVLTGLVRAAREAAPELTLVVTGACGGNITGLVQLDPGRLGDDRLLYSFHFYEPHGFTHQGTAQSRLVKGAPWPVTENETALSLVYSELLVDEKDPTPAERSAKLAEISRYLDEYAAGGWNEDALRARFGQVRAWAEKNGVPGDRLILGEFGAMAESGWHGGALDAHRFLWLDAVRREADALGAAWAYWEYANPHGMSLMSPDETRRPDRIALIALGLAEDPASTGN
jgi:endoglucanase